MIAIEDLKVKNMTGSAKGTVERPGTNIALKPGLNRSILEQSWGMFRQSLTDTAINATAPVEIIAIHPAYTSIRCSECDHTDQKHRKSQAIFCCRSCGYADVNAAKNTLAAGLAVTGHGTSHVKPTGLSTPDPVKRQPAKAA
jgi:putative transposase